MSQKNMENARIKNRRETHLYITQSETYTGKKDPKKVWRKESNGRGRKSEHTKMCLSINRFSKSNPEFLETTGSSGISPETVEQHDIYQ